MDNFTRPWTKCDMDTNTYKEMKTGSAYVCAASQIQVCSCTDKKNINLEHTVHPLKEQNMRETQYRHEKKDIDEMEINNGCFGDGASERGRLGKTLFIC